MSKNDRGLGEELRKQDEQVGVPPRLTPEPGYVEKFSLNTISKLSCRIVDCDNDLHCFYAKSEKRLKHPRGHCQGCGADLVHWDSARVADVSDLAEKRRIMEQELLRHYFWEVEMDPTALAFARKHGRKRILEVLHNRIKKLRTPGNRYDGRDVGFKYHPVNYARHATATCCRTCIAYWFGFPADQLLTDDQIERLYRFASYYVNERLAKIPDDKPKKSNPGRSKKQDPKWVP